MANYIAFEERQGTTKIPYNSLFVFATSNEELRLKFKRSKRDIRSVALVNESVKSDFIDVLEYLSENEDIDAAE